MKILILCTGNSCRSKMAEAFLKSKRSDWEVLSAGTDPARFVHPKAIQVMEEIGIDIGDETPRNVDEFLATEFDYVITVCDGANESCPQFLGKVKHRLHIGFDDPASASGTEAEILDEFRRIRDEIGNRFQEQVIDQLDKEKY